MEDILLIKQEKAYRALLELDLLFKENNITYFLLAGSTLGAVRHKGFIPWDDDIDIGIFLKDKKKVTRILSENLSSDYLYQDNSINVTFPRLYGKVLDKEKGYGCIDIFPLVKTSDVLFKRKTHWIKRKILFKLYKAKLNYANLNETNNLKEKTKVFIAKCLSSFISMNRVIKWIENNENKYENLEDFTYLFDFYGAYAMENQTIKLEWIYPLNNMKFENNSFPVFRDTDKYLTNVYGDYMTPPKMNNRLPRHEETFLK